ncbi:MAG: hypothetical protein JXM72_03690, partial [Deltaproteobacteria bacterium]|nr:hypothetical protein [Deltaproteobacteria bacterium]
MGTFTTIARQTKDRAVSRTLETLGQSYARRFGKIMDLKLDSENKEIHLEILLKGESDPVTIHVWRYEIISEGGRHYLVAGDIAVSREWMEALA